MQGTHAGCPSTNKHFLLDFHLYDFATFYPFIMFLIEFNFFSLVYVVVFAKSLLAHESDKPTSLVCEMQTD
jgi:hypothetical protein